MKMNVKQVPEKEVAVEVMASSIVSIADGIKKLRSGRLNDRALTLLIQHACPSYGGYPKSKPSAKDIKSVLEGMASLETTYLRKSAP